MDTPRLDETQDPATSLYRQEGDRLWRAMFAFTRDREMASDAVAEAFAQCIRRGEAIRSPRDWVWKVAFRIAAGELQERGRWRPLPRDREASGETSEAVFRLFDALANLS